MRMTLEDWKNGWVGVDLQLSVPEIEELIGLLRMIQSDADQHFHLSSDFAGEGGVGEITFSQNTEGQPGNCNLSGKALAPGTEI